MQRVSKTELVNCLKTHHPQNWR